MLLFDVTAAVLEACDAGSAGPASGASAMMAIGVGVAVLTCCGGADCFVRLT